MFQNHPKGLIPAALSNMGERFGYYIMAAVLTLFICSKFGYDDATASLIYSVFLAAIYVLGLVGGIIADKTGNYKGTIMTGVFIMAAGYAVLAVPITATASNGTFLISLTIGALVLIAFGNGLFKGNVQAIVGQLYDDFEEEAQKKGADAYEKIKGQRDAGFQIFYVFINIGGLVAPFIAPFLRKWWLGLHNFKYVAEAPGLFHQFLRGELAATDPALVSRAQEVGLQAVSAENCQSYLQVFNEGVHFAFIASVIAMAISIVIFYLNRQKFPDPAKKVQASATTTTEEQKAENAAMAKEMKQRLYALFAVLGVVVFFWFSFHQNGVSLSLFARDFVNSSAIEPEIWQSVNPFFVIVLTPVIMLFFSALSSRGKEISTPRKIAIGMLIAGSAYAFLAVYSYAVDFPSGTAFKELAPDAQDAWKAGPWVMIVTYFLLTVAELFISPLGLSFVSKVAPKNMLGLCQGLWLGTTALGNLLLPIGAVLFNGSPLWVCWSVFVGVCLLSMGVMLAMVNWLERVTK